MKENKSSSNLKSHVKSPKGKVSKAVNGASQSKKAVTNGTDKKTGSKELTKKEPKTRVVKPKKSVDGASSAAKRIYAGLAMNTILLLWFFPGKTILIHRRTLLD